LKLIESYTGIPNGTIPTMITFEHGMSAQFMTFFLGEKTSEQLFLRNESDNEFIAFKIQCTASKKFRVRPTFGYMDPAHATIVTFQLSAQVSNYEKNELAQTKCLGERGGRLQVSNRGPRFEGLFAES
jgi:hypothetical protein